MDYGDLQSLFTMAGPATAGWNAGVKEFQDQRANDLAAIIKEEEARKMRQEYGHSELMNPLKIQQQGLTNQGLEAELPGKRATSSKLVDEADISSATKKGKIDKFNREERLAALKTKLDEGDTIFKLATQAARFIGNGPDAEARKMQLLESGTIPPGPFFDALSKTPASEMFSELAQAQEDFARLKDDYIKTIGQVQETGRQQRLTEEQAIKAGKYAKAPGKFGISFEQKLEAETDPMKRLGLLIDGAEKAKQAGNDELAESYIARAKALEATARASKPALATPAGKPDIGQMGVPTVPPAPLVPGASAKPPVSSLADVQKMYPGVPADKLREAYKRKFGVDLQ